MSYGRVRRATGLELLEAAGDLLLGRHATLQEADVDLLGLERSRAARR